MTKRVGLWNFYREFPEPCDSCFGITEVVQDYLKAEYGDAERDGGKMAEDGFRAAHRL